MIRGCQTLVPTTGARHASVAHCMGVRRRARRLPSRNMWLVFAPGPSDLILLKKYKKLCALLLYFLLAAFSCQRRT